MPSSTDQMCKSLNKTAVLVLMVLSKKHANMDKLKVLPKRRGRIIKLTCVCSSNTSLINKLLSIMMPLFSATFWKLSLPIANDPLPVGGGKAVFLIVKRFILFSSMGSLVVESDRAEDR